MDIQKELSNFRDAQNRRDARRRKIDELNARFNDLTAKLQGLMAASKVAEDHKASVLSDFMNGEASQKDVESARHAHEQAVKAETESADLLVAVTAASEREQSYGDGLRSAEMALWAKVANELKMELTALAAGHLRRYQAAYAMSGRGYSWKDLLQDVFGPGLRDTDIRPTCEALKKEILVD